MIGYPSGQDGVILPARDISPGPARSKIIFWCFIPYNKALAKRNASHRKSTQVLPCEDLRSLAIGWPNATQVERKSFAKAAEFLFFFFFLGSDSEELLLILPPLLGLLLWFSFFLCFFNSLSLFSFSSSGLKFSEFCSVTEALLSKGKARKARNSLRFPLKQRHQIG